MALSPYDTVAEKVLLDLEMAVKRDTSINEFDVIPTSEAENKNSSPILKGGCSLGLESWIIPHIYPFAHHQIVQKSNYKAQNLERVISCLFGVALLNPEMSTVWSRRRELILSRKMQKDNELRLTRMALSRKPKSNEALAHRRWIITELLKNAADKAALLQEELTLCEMIANRYHSNYHAWSHRMWALQHLLPDPPYLNFKRKMGRSPVVEMRENELSKLLFCNISKTKYLFMVNSEFFHLYSEEIDNNFKWVSSHVSDHSGFHFRTFLMNQMFNYLKSSFYSVNNTDFENDDILTTNTIQYKSDTSFFVTRKIILIEFLKGLENENCFKKVLEEFINNLEQNSSLFDLIVSIIISEMKSNHSLCLMFPGHEALWYYRRSLIHLFKHYILDNVYSSNQTMFSHQDKNGVPHRKDLRYDYTVKADDHRLNTKLSDLFCIFHSLVIKNEEDIVLSVLKSSDENEKKLVRDYERWLKFCLKIN